MNFVNNWHQPFALAEGVTDCALDLPDGSYRLTVADKLSGASRWEVIDAEVEGGEAWLTRGVEGTLDQGWPEGSVIYCSVTAGIVQDLVSAVETLKEKVFQLTPVDPGYVASGASDDYAFGYSREGQSSISPLGKIGAGTSVVPGSEMVEGAPGEVLEAVWYNVESPYLRLAWRSTVGSDAPSAPFSELWLGNQPIDPLAASFFGGYGEDLVAMELPLAVNPLPAGEIISFDIY